MLPKKQTLEGITGPAMLNISTKEAIDLLRSGSVVALPTETVYGLASSIFSDLGLKNIFSIKARPFFDPLIVHVFDKKSSENIASWDSLSIRLAEKFWPGPLTLILPKKKLVKNIVTSGKPTVALRSPSHPIFRSVLKGAGAPLAAPSANRFGKISPTAPAHVHEEFEGRVPVVDGGSCSLGIESTIVEVQKRQQLSAALEEWNLSNKIQIIRPNKPAGAPGQMEDHYQPDTPLILCLDTPSAAEEAKKALEASGLASENPSISIWAPLDLSDRPEIAARSLYGDLRLLNSQGLSFILCTVTESMMSDPRWEGVMDRLKKASHLTVGKNFQWLDLNVSDFNVND